MTTPHRGESPSSVEDRLVEPELGLRPGRQSLAGQRPPFALLMDEAAVALHAVAPVKGALMLVGGAMGVLILPLTTCLLWIAGGLALEFWGWRAAHRQARGETIGKLARASFMASYVAVVLWWGLLAVLFWASGSAGGQATAAALVVAVGALILLLFYNTPIVFLVTGAAPAMAALAVIGLADGSDWRQMAPVWIALGLTLIFNAGRAIDTPSAQESQRQLNDSLKRYEILAENVGDIIVRTDMRGVHQYVSPASQSVLGYSPEELVGGMRLDLIHPDDADIIASSYRRMMADMARTEVLTVRVRHKDGRWLWLQTSARLVVENGVPVGAIDVSRDVTDTVIAAAALTEAKLEAESANRAKAEFLANVSHEIRTPMNGVLGALHQLEREDISTEGRELMRQANDCGRMLSQLLNDVLDFSKIEAGQLDLAPEPMNAGDALRAVTALLDGNARAKGVELRCEIDGGDLWIEADPVRLQQAMYNLVGNAVKFTTQGHVATRLVVTSTADGRRHVRLEVQDTGIGMKPEARDHLFERFRQTESDTTRRFGGTGLGLPITVALARMMGGDLDYSSVEGEGSTFWFDFTAPAARPVTAEPVEAGLLDGVQILLVEDNPTNRLVARTMLTRLGASVAEAEDGVVGLEAARTGAYDLILMDVQMPHMDGVQATRAIRGLMGSAGQTPIIGLTANAMVHQRAEYLAAGMNGVVAKPISPTALLTEIARLTAPDEARLAG